MERFPNDKQGERVASSAGVVDLGGWVTLERNVPIPRCPRGRSGGRSRPSTSWRSWPSTTPRRRARRGRCCAGRACTRAISSSGARRAMRARWPGWRCRAAASAVARRPRRSPALRPRSASWSRSWPRPASWWMCRQNARALGDALRERGHRAEVDAMTDQAVAELAGRIGVRDGCVAMVRRRPATTGATASTRHLSGRRRSRTANGRNRVPERPGAAGDPRVLHSDRLSTCPRPRCGPRCSTKVSIGSQSTFYRLLRQAGEVCERRAQATHPAKVKPELIANGPNQVWSWDITKLLGQRNGPTTTFT